MSNDLLKSLSGKFVVFDGPDGCGKTTQLKTLIAKLDKAGVKVRRLREPGGTPIGEQIRDLLLSTKNSAMEVRCEMLLYMASRAQLVHEQIDHRMDAIIHERSSESQGVLQGCGTVIQAGQAMAVDVRASGRFALAGGGIIEVLIHKPSSPLLITGVHQQGGNRALKEHGRHHPEQCREVG